MTVASVAAFWAVSMVFVITPGVDWAYAMAAGSRRQGVFWSVTGMLAGHFAATLAVAAGLAALLAASPPAMRLLTIAGSFYLVWLGVGSLRHSLICHAGSQRLSHPRLYIQRLFDQRFRPDEDRW